MLESRVLTHIFNQLLASTFKGQRAARHLLVVAASSPLEVNTVSGGSGAPEWQRIAQKLQEVFFLSLASTHLNAYL
jgi:hypothetical protein